MGPCLSVGGLSLGKGQSQENLNGMKVAGSRSAHSGALSTLGEEN